MPYAESFALCSAGLLGNNRLGQSQFAVMLHASNVRGIRIAFVNFYREAEFERVMQEQYITAFCEKNAWKSSCLLVLERLLIKRV